jgi:hypothetical protein
MKWGCAPQDISLIGYDNVRNARYFSPALTTIHQPKDSLGEAAFNMLWIVSSTSVKSRSLSKFTLVWSNAAPWRMARLSIIVIASAGADHSGARSHSRFSVSLSPR